MTTEVGCRSWRRSVEWKDGFEEGRRVLFGALGLEIALGRVGEVSGGRVDGRSSSLGWTAMVSFMSLPILRRPLVTCSPKEFPSTGASRLPAATHLALAPHP